MSERTDYRFWQTQRPQCKAIKTGSDERCVKAAIAGGYCKYHAIREGILVWCGYCDEYTAHGTANCVLPIVN